MTANPLLGRSQSSRKPATKDSHNPFIKPSPPLQPSGPSYVRLFLTNLRLLNFDLRRDWPNISLATFSTRNDLQDQKKRIQSVEWALYQLFGLWDPIMTRDALQPFFPPLEPLQSRNLRQALYRCLDHLKKSGVLGRDTVMRKTMLDECKGERLEEVLAVFSTAVLKRMVQDASERDGSHQAVAQTMAMESINYSGEKSVLMGLIVAHKGSLTKALRIKADGKERYHQFACTLDLKREEIEKNRRQLQSLVSRKSEEEKITSTECRNLRNVVQRNWSGGNEWLRVVAHGESNLAEDVILDKPYDEVWQHVENGSLGQVQMKAKRSLLLELDGRVKAQQSRLSKWREFEKSLVTTSTPKVLPVDAEDNTGVKKFHLVFNGHEALQLSTDAKSAGKTKTWTPLEEYRTLVEDMQRDLASISKPKQSLKSTHFVQREDYQQGDSFAEYLEGEQPEPARAELDLDSDLDDLSEISSVPDHAPQQFEEDFSHSESGSPKPASVNETEGMVPMQEEFAASPTLEATTAYTSKEPSYIPQETPMHQNKSAQRVRVESPSLAASTSPDAAAQILASMQAVSPSPTKPRHVLSLADRTRFSLSQVSSRTAHLEDFDDLPDIAAPKFTTSPTAASVPRPKTTAIEAREENAVVRGESDLARRTRQSIGNLEEMTKNAQLERRKSLKRAEKARRASFMPKPLEASEEAGEDSLEGSGKLIEEAEAGDYESVFKSRPKINLSPVVSPMKTWGELGGRSPWDEQESEGNIG